MDLTAKKFFFIIILNYTLILRCQTVTFAPTNTSYFTLSTGVGYSFYNQPSGTFALSFAYTAETSTGTNTYNFISTNTHPFSKKIVSISFCNFEIGNVKYFANYSMNINFFYGAFDFAFGGGINLYLDRNQNENSKFIFKPSLNVGYHNFQDDLEAV